MRTAYLRGDGVRLLAGFIRSHSHAVKIVLMRHLNRFAVPVEFARHARTENLRVLYRSERAQLQIKNADIGDHRRGRYCR